jgi:uncharacterized repeat protein (TIGR03803 family)
MYRRKLNLASLRLSAMLLLGFFAFNGLAVAQTETTLWQFTETTNFWPQGGLVEDALGNLYGATKGGGTYGVGTVFELSPPAKSGGAWTETTLYNFPSYGNTGYVPSSELTADSVGNFYGTTFVGGDSVCGCGVVYELSPPAKQGGAWTEAVLYAFKSQNDGRLPTAALTFGSGGTIYGVTEQGGTYDSGTIFQLVPGNGGAYAETVLYSFGNIGDASTPSGPLALDSAGALYGVTSLGGTFNQGAAYKFTPSTVKGQAGTEQILFSFGGGTLASGINPVGNLIFDSTGNLYGVTNAGGSSSGYGVVYELSSVKGVWSEKVLYSFIKNSGVNPQAGMTWNPSNGALFGTTTNLNGASTGSGSVFQLTPPAVKGGKWTETTLFQFLYANNGGYPAGRITRDPNTGSLYGTAAEGGLRNCDLFCGTVWQIVNP